MFGLRGVDCFELFGGQSCFGEGTHGLMESIYRQTIYIQSMLKLVNAETFDPFETYLEPCQDPLSCFEFLAANEDHLVGVAWKIQGPGAPKRRSGMWSGSHIVGNWYGGCHQDWMRLISSKPSKTTGTPSELNLVSVSGPANASSNVRLPSCAVV